MSKTIVINKKAKHDYIIVESFEAGLVLTGTEVKSLREQGPSLTEAFVEIKETNGRLLATLRQLSIPHYSHGNQFNHEPARARILLLHKKEIHTLYGNIIRKGYTAIPLSLYYKNGLVKVSIGLCKGKSHQDRREDLKKKDADREMEKAMKKYR